RAAVRSACYTISAVMGGRRAGSTSCSATSSTVRPVAAVATASYTSGTRNPPPPRMASFMAAALPSWQQHGSAAGSWHQDLHVLPVGEVDLEGQGRAVGDQGGEARQRRDLEEP